MNLKDKKSIPANKNTASPLTILARSMDGPSVAWTVADLTKVNNKFFMTYHVMASGYDYLTPLGCAIGAGALPYTSKFSTLTRLQAAGTGGLIGGTAGMGLGFMLMMKIANSKSPKLPWDEDGIQTRVDGISHNYRVRAMDLGVWLGMAAAGATMVYAGGPTKLGLSSGTFGKFQAVALGSAMGSVTANVFISATK
jgi:hypothetical protein